MMALLGASNPIEHVIQHTWLDLNPGGGVFSFPLISNHILMQVAGAALLIWGIPRALAFRAGDDPIGRLVPRGFGTAIEAVCVALREQIFKPNLVPRVHAGEVLYIGDIGAIYPICGMSGKHRVRFRILILDLCPLVIMGRDDLFTVFHVPIIV